MTIINYDKIVNEFIYDGFFSEYLPPSFSVRQSFDPMSIDLKEKNDLVEPLHFNMSRFSEDGKRRTIYIPEFSSYLSTMKYIKDNNIIPDLVELSNSTHSFSPILQGDNSLTRHEKIYSRGIMAVDGDQESITSTYIPNIIDKINRARGAKGVLCLDIASFYSSIYTHLIPSIKLGYEVAEQQYKLCKADNSSSDILNDYRIYVKLDEHIRNMNGARTNGLLTGTLVSQFIAETLLSRIDKEIEQSNIKFVRYVDDYEIFIYDENKISSTQNKISAILNKYFLELNNEKTKYVKFPYYVVDNLEKIYSDYTSQHISDTDIIKLFNTYFELESNGVKGAIRFLVKSLNERFDCHNKKLYASYLLDILVNDSRSLVKVCELIIRQKEQLEISDKDIRIIEKLILQHLNSDNHLETIWLLYLRRKLSSEQLCEDISNAIIKSNNELAIIMLMEEYNSSLSDTMIDEIVESSTSWILCYQLFLKDKLNKSEFSNKSGIKSNINFYAILRRNHFTFYKC